MELLITILVLVSIVAVISAIKSIKPVLVAESELGFVYKDGKLVDVVEAGKHLVFFDKTMELVDMNRPFYSKHELNRIMRFPVAASKLDIVEICDNELGIEYKEGLFSGVLQPGRYGYWNADVQYTVEKVNTESNEISKDFPRSILAKREMLQHIECFSVAPYELGLLYIDGSFIRKLVPGTYYFWKNERPVIVQKADLRTQQVEVSGQEILTKDKAAVRVNFDAQFRVVDIEQALKENKDAIRQMYTTVQLALREYIGTLTLDNILSRKEEVAPFVLTSTANRIKQLGLELVSGGLRDIILPGDVKEIMNQVLLAQKKAQANNIMRQEETASTRSLLNTAKLMEQNDMLFRLKEMEYVERIAEKVGEISVGGNEHVLAQLKGLFSGQKN